MLELVDNVDLKSIAVRRTGSSPVVGTKNKSKLALDILTNQCYIVYVIT